MLIKNQIKAHKLIKVVDIVNLCIKINQMGLNYRAHNLQNIINANIAKIQFYLLKKIYANIVTNEIITKN